MGTMLSAVERFVVYFGEMEIKKNFIIKKFLTRHN
jgi:hypothetical protein